MNVNPANFLSTTERVYLDIFGIAISSLNLTNILIVWLEKASNPPPFGIYDIARASLFPTGRFLSVFVFLFLLFAKRYFFSLGWVVLCLAPPLYQFIVAYQVIYYDVDLLYKTPAFALIRMIANPLDYLSFFLLIALLVWLVSVIVRSFTMRKTGTYQ